MSKKYKVIVINGPNLNLLGKREPDIYGTATLEDIEVLLKAKVRDYPLELEFFQSNSEGNIIDIITSNYGMIDFLIINPGAYAHYSIAIRDALSSVDYKAIEVHISNIFAREDFRRTSCIAPACWGTISGFGICGYALALEAIIGSLKN